MPNCKQCRASFEITNSDLAFYDKVSPVFNGKKYQIPPPTLCPEHRWQRRLAWRNERKLYHRECDLCGNTMISIYSGDKSFTVYCCDCFWSDRWDPMGYGKTSNFSQQFFEQIKELQKAVPRHKVLTMNCENCDYSPWQIDCRNCYLCTGGRYNEDCYYCFWPVRCENCVDCTLPHRSKYCYECVDALSSYECIHSIYLDDCSQCTFCYDCIGCNNCLLCTGLRHKQYCILNKQYSKDEYCKMIQEFKLDNQQHFSEAKNKFDALMQSIIHRDMRLINCENCTGDLIKNSRNVLESYNVEGSEDCKFLYDIRDAKDCFDLYIGGFNDELSYEGVSILDSPRTRFSTYCWEGCDKMYYCDHCFSCQNCFGCIGLRHKKYCILNKQYSKEDYEKLVPRIIEHMKETGEWGEFFPVEMGPFAYNETVAQEYFPMTKEEVEAKGWKWRNEKDEIPDVEKIMPADRLPDSIDDIPDDILNWAIKCEATGRPFKIVKQELSFYRKHKLPIPRFHPDERHRRRMALRNPRKLWTRKCDKCGKEIQTTYAPDRPEKVYCEECYLQAVY